MSHNEAKARLCYEHRDKPERPALCHVCQRLLVEHKIARRLVRRLKQAGFTVVVDNGEEQITPEPQTVDSILSQMFQTDLETLRVIGQGNWNGWIMLVYGNDGYDVISDYTVNLEDVLAPVNEYATTFEV